MTGAMATGAAAAPIYIPFAVGVSPTALQVAVGVAGSALAGTVAWIPAYGERKARLQRVSDVDALRKDRAEIASRLASLATSLVAASQEARTVEQLVAETIKRAEESFSYLPGVRIALLVYNSQWCADVAGSAYDPKSAIAFFNMGATDAWTREWKLLKIRDAGDAGNAMQLAEAPKGGGRDFLKVSKPSDTDPRTEGWIRRPEGTGPASESWARLGVGLTDGWPIGVLCVDCTEPHVWDTTDYPLLRAFANVIQAGFELASYRFDRLGNDHAL